VDRRIAEPVHDERDAADVVQVAVRDDDAADAVLVMLEVLRIREDVVHARVRVLGDELEARIYDEDVVTDFDGAHVAADFLDAAQGDDAYDVRRDRGREVVCGALRGRRAGAAQHAAYLAGFPARTAAAAAAASSASAVSAL